MIEEPEIRLYNIKKCTNALSQTMIGGKKYAAEQKKFKFKELTQPEQFAQPVTEQFIQKTKQFVTQQLVPQIVRRRLRQIICDECETGQKQSTVESSGAYPFESGFYAVQEPRLHILQ
nr:hypothetical protein [Lachnospiraceae bacterium]